MSDTARVTLQVPEAVEVLALNLHTLHHPNGTVRLVRFAHDSDGVRAVKKQAAESVVLCLESHSYQLVKENPQ